MPGFLVGVGKAGDVAERSPAVISANLKENMFLQKKLVVLKRSERSIVHQIRVDQKVMYTRFQARLACSKLAHARLMGQKALETQLREKSIGGLNTAIAGNADEDYAFIAKLEQRQCTSNSYTPRVPPPVRYVNIRSKSKDDSKLEKESTSALQLRHCRSSSARHRYGQENVHVTIGSQIDSVSTANKNVHASNERRTEARHVATVGDRLRDDFIHQQRTIKEQDRDMVNEIKNNINEKTSKSDNESLSEMESKSNDKNSIIPISDNEKTDIKPNVAFLEALDIGEARPRTTADVTQWNYIVPSSPTSPKQCTGRSSRAADFFQADEKIDHVALRLQEAKTLDFTENVHRFCVKLEEMKCARASHDVDYYSMRLHMSLDKAPSRAMLPETPDDENKRSVGNVFIRSLTLPQINWNFQYKRL